MRANLRPVLIWLLTTVFCAPVAVPQGKPPARAQRAPAAKVPPPPFLEQLKSFEDTQFVTRAVLKNGLTVLIVEFRAVPLVSVSMWVPGGTAAEPENLSGVSELLAAVAPYSTEKRTPGILARDIRALGGEWATAVETDHIAFDLTVPSAQWKRALELQADAYYGAQLDDGACRRAIDRIELASSAAKLDPGRLLTEAYLDTAYTSSGIRRGHSINASGLRAAVGATLREYRKAAFAPERSMLLVAGDVVAVEVMNEVAKQYARPPAAAIRAPAPAPVEPPQTSFRYRALRTDSVASGFLLGFRVAGQGSQDWAAVEVLRQLVGGGESSVLRRRLAYEKGLIQRGQTLVTGPGNDASMVIHCETDQASLDQAEIGLVSELEILKEEEVDEVELERAISAAEREYWDGLQTLVNRAHQKARQELLGEWKRVNPIPERLRKVTAADVKRAANRYLSLESATIVEVLPAGGETRNLTAEVLYRTLKDLAGPAAEQELAAREKKPITAVEIPEEKIPFNFSEIRHAFQVASVLRGPDLFIKEDHTTPLIHLAVVFPGGKSLEKRDSRGVTYLMLRSMMRGTRNRDPEQLWRQLEVYGASVTPVVRDEYFGYEMTILSRHVELGLSLLMELIRYPRFDKDELERLRGMVVTEMSDRLRSNTLDPAVRQALFGSHSYGVSTYETSAVAKLTLESVVAWYKLYVENKKPMAVIIGDTQGTSLAQYFVKNFSGVRIQDVKLAKEAPKSTTAISFAAPPGDGPTGSAVLALQAPPEADEDSYAVRILASFFNGIGGRLEEQILEKSSAVFDVGCTYSRERAAGSLTFRASTAAGREEEALESLKQEIRKFLSSPPNYREFRSALNSAIGEYWIEQQLRSQQIGLVIGSVLAGTSLDGAIEVPTRIQEVTLDDIDDVAKRILSLDRAVSIQVPARAETR